MKKTVRRRRFITLIEIMIVMFLIAMITGVVAYNYKGTLDEGRAFKTQQGIEKVRTILLLSIADNPEVFDRLSECWESCVKASPLASNGEALIKDGWGVKYEVTPLSGPSEERDIQVRSARFDAYIQNHPSLFHDTKP